MQKQSYTRLEDLLNAQKWKKADLETQQLMLSITGREKEKWLRDVDVDDYELPPEDLQAIDQLWLKYSNNQFGFSVQKRIYLETGNSNSYNVMKWIKFGSKVGWFSGIPPFQNWISDLKVIYDISAPPGHLPWVWLYRNIWECNEQTRTAYPALIMRDDLKVS